MYDLPSWDFRQTLYACIALMMILLYEQVRKPNFRLNVEFKLLLFVFDIDVR